MRKKILALAILFQLSSPIHPAGGSAVDVVMSIQELGAQFFETSLDVPINAGDNYVRSRSVVKNSGNGNQDYSIKVSSADGPSWTMVSSTPLANQYRLHAIWHQDSILPGTTEYQNNDLLTSDGQTSSTSTFFNDQENHQISGWQGFNTAPGQYTSLFVWVEGPPTSTFTGGVTAHILVTPLASP